MPMKAIFPPGSGKTLAPYSPGAMADGIVYVAGTLALDAETNVVHVGDAAAQTEYVLNAIKSVIETAGGTMADVTFNSIFITDWPITLPSTASMPSFSRATSRRATASSAAW